MNGRELEYLFKKISSDKPSKPHLDKLREFPNRQKATNFLIGKLKKLADILDGKEEWDNKLEWGVINACGILGEFKAEQAIGPLIKILDNVKDDWQIIINDVAANALEKMGEPALEPVYKKYVEDCNVPEYVSIWLGILSSLGVREKRIHRALIDYFAEDSAMAVNYMADYGDRDLLRVSRRCIGG